MSSATADEPLLSESNNRYTMFPIKYPDIYEMYKRQVDSFWKTDEVDLSKDHNDWKMLTDDERYYISRILAFFAASDGIVMENLNINFCNEVKIPEARAFYAMQNFMESVHSEMYSLLIDTYIKDEEEKNKLFNAIENYPCVAKKTKWAQKWMSGRSSFAARLVAFGCIEAIHFSGSFSSIVWLKKRGLMPGLTMSNDQIRKDESMHTDFCVLLYSKLVKKLSKKKVIEILREAAEIEKEFVCDAIPCRMIGMNSELMCQYIEFVTDRLSLQLGYEKIFHATNPFDFMQLVDSETKTNFFEKRVTEYALSNTKKDENVFDFDFDF
jgi:ribonucleoside-diphosphate reductase subunit M2